MDSGLLTVKRVWVMLLSLSLMYMSCKSDLKFDKEKWNTQTDPAYPPDYRSRMVNDLTKHYQLTGLHYSQLIQLLGTPTFNDSAREIDYDLDIDYGTDIDPVYVKRLIFYLSKDSVVTSFKIEERHNH